METLFGVSSKSSTISVESGIAGKVSAYFGTVESQGRGSLHLHLLVFLEGSPSPQRMRGLLERSEFREKVTHFMRSVIHADIPGLSSKEGLREIPNDVEIAWTRPPNPRLPNVTYDDELRKFEIRVARAKQVHTCSHRRCLTVDKHGRYRCKRRAPFPLSDVDVVHPDGSWQVKRSFAYLNGWMPALSINLRCNNDCKLLTNGGDTKNISFYAVSSYQTKKQGKNYNTSAVMARAYGFHLERSSNADYIQELRDQQRLLLFRMAHAINQQQELAAPMVLSYIMGWGDVIRSHHYSTIFWSTFERALHRCFPSLRRGNEGDSDRSTLPDSQTNKEQTLSNVRSQKFTDHWNF